MATRTVEQRIRLERRLYALPGLREAMTAGRVSYEQARLVADAADGDTLEGWIVRAEKTTCIALRREIEAEDDAQMCARGELAIRAPERVASLLGEAFRATRAAEGRWLTRPVWSSSALHRSRETHASTSCCSSAQQRVPAPLSGRRTERRPRIAFHQCLAEGSGPTDPRSCPSCEHSISSSSCSSLRARRKAGIPVPRP